MKLFFSTFISSLIQILLFGFIPFIWWRFRANDQTFFNWLGLKKVPKEKIKLVIVKSLIVLTIYVSVTLYILFIFKDLNTATDEFIGLGIIGLIPGIIYAFFHTAFSEEILFRGFLLKRIKNKLGFKKANIIQGFLFALLHVVFFINHASIYQLILLTLMTWSIAIFMGYINEKEADGSIIPSWLIHSASNLITVIIVLFNLV